MKNLNPAYFFDLTHFKHKKIFETSAFVFHVLSKIENYLKTEHEFKIEVAVPEGVILVNPELISIGKETVLEAGAYIKGPCIIGQHCTIRHGAYIRGNVITGDHCVIGHDTEIKNTIMLNHAHAAHFAYLGDSILGNHVNLGAGTKCANLKLDGKEISLIFEDTLVRTGLRKLGAIIGDGCQLGCNSVTNPGTFLGKNVSCYPCTNFGGFVDSDSLIKPNTINIIKKKF